MSEDKPMTGRELLTIPMQENDAHALTVGGYLQALLLRLWELEEGFSGKRPFGNSGWTHDLYRPLIAARAASGRLDADGFVADKGNADEIVYEAIEALFTESDAKNEAAKIAALALRREAERIESSR